VGAVHVFYKTVAVRYGYRSNYQIREKTGSSKNHLPEIFLEWKIN